MISLLIPVYNYQIIDLVTTLHKQLELCHIDFEVICFDDGSDAKYTCKNETLNTLNYVTYNVSNANLGRTKARQILAEKAKYKWLLFLDADVIPKTNEFITNYITYLSTDYDVVNGGIAYKDQEPEPDYLLRWKYGRQQEQKSASYRNKKSYKIITSGNFLIKKALFLNLNSNIEQNTYGLDNIFGAALKSKNAKVFHINNEVYHLGLETNTTYLKKKENSALTVLSHHKSGKIKEHDNDLLHLFLKVKRFGLNYFFVIAYKLFGKSLKKNLLGQNPSIRLLQFYRICYMCYKDLQT